LKSITFDNLYVYFEFHLTELPGNYMEGKDYEVKKPEGAKKRKVSGARNKIHCGIRCFSDGTYETYNFYPGWKYWIPAEGITGSTLVENICDLMYATESEFQAVVAHNQRFTSAFCQIIAELSNSSPEENETEEEEGENQVEINQSEHGVAGQPQHLTGKRRKRESEKPVEGKYLLRPAAKKAKPTETNDKKPIANKFGLGQSRKI